VNEFLGQPAGYAWLIERHGLEVPRPRHRSYVRDDAGARKEIADGFLVDESFPAAYRPGEEDFDHLVFALKYDGVDLCILSQMFRRIDRRSLSAGIEARPASKYGRRLFFFFELLTGERLPLPDLSGAYHPALEPERYVVSAGRREPRHRVTDNLLGVRGFCPIVRRTMALDGWRARDLTARAQTIAADVDPVLLARALHYLYTKETKSSFAIEREEPGSREERFAEQLARVGSLLLDTEADLVALQHEIVMEPYRESHFRREGEPDVYVGESVGVREIVHHVGARSEIVPELMRAWSSMRSPAGPAAAVIEAACRSFGFVFIHPFGDGNGRIHRLLLHHTLARRAFFPDHLVVPVSAVLLRSPSHYDQILEDFSRRVMPSVRYTLDESGEITILDAPDDAYRYPDLTPQCEAVFEWLSRALEEDLVQELEYLRKFDEIRQRLREVIEMPDRKERLFIRLCLENRGRLPKRKRRLFAELDDSTVERLEAVVLEILQPQ
jgi:hypothetical protein